MPISGSYNYPGVRVANSPFPYLPTNEVRAVDAHLVLSSGFGSIVAFSGVAKFGRYAQSSLPAGSDTLSGSIAWVTDKKCFAIYGPEGWQRLSSGTL